jgi:DNA-binding NtrC family response regulator
MLPRIVMLSTLFLTSLLPLAAQAQPDSTHMGHGAHLLVIGRHADMMAKVSAMLTSHGYQPHGALTNDAAFAIFQDQPIAAVVIGGGVDDESRARFHREFVRLRPGVHVIDAHPQTLLAALKAALPDPHPDGPPR